MYLKRLELHGFKSFAPRTTLEFSPGITAIVGPNGSGKSNLADGVRWVLGEQSMRQLRGKKSDDVIFAGGQTRATMQMAEVGLVLDNSASWLPSEFSEVTVARRSFRNGENEYLTNGTRVRLKDVLMLLAQARIGHDSYTVIGQGLVDQALSLRADERRGLFEDAAGIRQFQAQRQEAEQKLNLTAGNLSRLRDILGEIEPRLAPLAEQARRATEFTASREELTRLLRTWYRRQWRELLTARQHAEAAEAEHEARIQKLQDGLAVEDALTQELRTKRDALLAEIAALRRERGEVGARLQTSERELAVARERLASVERQATDLSGEQEQQEESVAAAQAHIAALEAQVAAAEGNATESAAALEQLDREAQAARQSQEREEARLRAAQRDAIQVQARLGAAQTELGRLQRQLGERNRALAARRDAAASATGKLDAISAQLEERRARFDAAHTAVETLVATKEQLARESAEGQAEVERLRGAAADAQRERRAVADRLALLEEWRRNLEGFDDGVRALLQADAQDRPALLGVIAQLVGAQPGFEAAVEAALGAFLHAAVVPTEDDARRAAALLRAASAGRALIVWLDGGPVGRTLLSADGRPAPSPEAATPAADGTEYLGLVRDAATCRDELRSLVARLLGDTCVVRDLGVLERDFAGKPLPAPFVTLEGEMIHPAGWLRGGRAKPAPGAGQEAGVLARERELRQLPAEVDRLAGVISELQAQLADAQARQAERTSRGAALAKEVAKAEAQAQELAKAVTALTREQERAQNDLTLGQTVVEQLAAEVTGLEQEVAATEARLAEQEEAQRAAAERVEDVQAEVDEILAKGRRQQEELARGRTAVALQRQEAKALGQRAEQVRGQARELQAQLHRRAERLQILGVQKTQLAETIAEHEAALTEARTQAQALTEQIRERDARQAELERRALELERGQSVERQELARQEVEYRRCIVESQRARDAVEALAQQIGEELADDGEDDPLPSIIGGSAAAESGEDAAPAPSPEEAAKMRRQIDSLRNRLKHLGGYDPEAPQAYAELKTRHDFLTAQVRDMEQASANLHAVIAELDATMRRQFEETFHAVNERFQRHFVTLFSGGAARLELTAPRRAPSDDEDDESGEEQAAPAAKGLGGVEVYVQIPGKKVQDLSLLSGGERAMVSAALLFALLETNPPPFCLLDEVDAALDEANVVRFCEILKQLAERTQFIIITHNRVTMTQADAIYGVSMGPESISRVVSMRLAEVTAAR
jgi:chromosome segregation protein